MFTMKLALAVIIFTTIIISLSSACQYKVNQTDQEFGSWLYDSNGNFFGEPLVLKDFFSKYMNIEGCNPPPSFKIYNQYSFSVTVKLTYTLFHPRINQFYPEAEQEMTTKVKIAPYSEERIDSTCLDIGTNEILNDTITYTISGLKSLTLKKGYINSTREVCKQCEEKDCLDDGAICKRDTQCGSNICNINNVCGATSSTYVVSCSDGKLNCKNQSCLTPSTKKVGEAYSCEWECTNGTIPCNNTCRAVSSKKPGEEYHCIQECKSGRGKEGVCLRSIEWWVYFWIICIFIVSVGIGYFGVYKWRKAKRKREEEERKLKAVMNEREDLQIEIDNYKKEIEKGGKKIIKLKEEIKNAEGKAKEDYELALREEKERQKSREIILIEKEKLLSSKEKEIEKRNKFAEDNINYTKKEIEAAILKYGGHKKLFFNGEYLQFKNGFNGNDKGPLYHTWLYINKLSIGINQEIHHIDGNKLNNEMWNLIAIDSEVHRYKVREAAIKNEGWEFGLKYLLDNGFVDKNKLHRYIKQHMSELKMAESI